MIKPATKPNLKSVKAKKVSKTVLDKARRKKLEKELDNLWKEIVHFKWKNKCAWPGCDKTNYLSAHHYFHKAQGNKARWLVDNGVLLCYGHHIGQVHRAGNVEELRDMLVQKLGQNYFDWMKQEVTKVFKPSLANLEQLQFELTVILNK
jgi:hypothetical protein